MRTTWRAHELDRELAAGTDPMLSDELSLRAGRLGAPRNRARLNYALRSAVDIATGAHPPLITTRIRREPILKNQDLMLALASRLLEGGPLGVKGLAITARLVDDHDSPLYGERDGMLLSAGLLQALDALGRGHRTAVGGRP